MSTNSYIQVPPDGTGKKLYAKQHTVGSDTVQGQVYHLADPDNPAYQQHIDSRGAASVRFSEGSPLSDAFGNLKVSQKNTIGTYEFVGEDNSTLYSDVVVSGGAVTHLSNASSISLSVNNTLGSFASRTSNKYHYYIPGTSNLIMLTVACSDTFMSGCERRWGYFDANNGAYFDLDDAGQLKVSIRSNVTGSLVKTHIIHDNWNGDKVDGTGLSGFNLDVTKVNIYWIDYQWLGAGRVRFGVIDDYGNRIVCHTVLNANHNLHAYMRSGSLPVQVNIENKAATGGSASIRLTCASVQTEGALDYTVWRYAHDFGTKTISGTNNYCMAVKSTPTFAGFHNCTNAYPESFDCFVAAGSIKVDIYWDYMTLATPTWALANGSTVVGDTAGTPTIAGTEYRAKTLYLDAGSHNIDLSKVFEKNDEGLLANADETEGQCIMIVATKLSGSPTIQGSLSYAELR